MKDVIIIEKPDTVSFEEIYKILYAAHEENRKNGIWINTNITNGEELEKHMGKNAVCYVALDNNKVVGTVSVDINEGDKWCTKNLKIVRLKYFAVLPECTGKGIGSYLCNKVEQYALMHEADAIDLYVVERNPARHMYIHKGYEAIEYIYRAPLKPNAVYMVKWLKKNKYPIWLRNSYYILKRFYKRMRYGGKQVLRQKL